MKAVVWPLDDDTEGAKFEVVDIPAEYADAAADARVTSCSRRSRTSTTRCSRSTSTTRSSPPTRSRPRSAPERSRSSSCRCCAARRSRTRACSPCSTRSSTTCRRRSTSRRPQGTDLKGESRRAQGERGRAVLGARVQDRRRPLRQAHVLPHLLGQAREGFGDLQLHEGPQGAHRAHPAHARQPARRHRGRVRGRHRRRARLQADDHRRHAVRPRHPIVLEQMVFPEPVISVAIEPKTKADQDKLGKALGSLSDEDPTFRVHTDEETGPDDHPPAWASCTSRCSSTG